MNMSFDDFISILSGLFFEHCGHDNVDVDAWLEEYERGVDPVSAFYNEFPEYEDLDS